VLDGVVTIPIAGRLNPLDIEGADGQDLGRGACQFLAGPENRLVEPALRAVFAGRPRRCNPLVLFGPSGTGKSHLAQGIAAEWKQNHPRHKVVCICAVDFSRELKDAIETQATDEFRARYRHAALLVLEDIDRLAGKQTAQEELLSTLDALVSADRQVVVTAAVAPSRLSGLMAGLRSRLTSGLTVPLVLPGADARLAILRRWAELRSLELAEPVARLLADSLKVTAGELLGALVQLEAAARLNKRAIDADLVRGYLAQARLRDAVALDRPGYRSIFRTNAD